MSEGVFCYFEKSTDSFLGKMDLSEALVRSRMVLNQTHGIPMKSLNDRPFLAFFKRSKKYVWIVNRKRSSNFKKRSLRNTFARKKK